MLGVRGSQFKPRIWLGDEIQKQSILQVLTKTTLHIMTDKLDYPEKNAPPLAEHFVYNV